LLGQLPVVQMQAVPEQLGVLPLHTAHVGPQCAALSQGAHVPLLHHRPVPH
jgi:hypothetical protein